MRLLVCGGRNYTDRSRVYNEIAIAINWVSYGNCDNDSWLPAKGTVIISGGAPGADQLAADWAAIHFVPLEEYIAAWELYGKAAGPIRNAQMLEQGKPDLVLAFPGGKGTANMVAQARAAGVLIKCIS